MTYFPQAHGRCPQRVRYFLDQYCGEGVARNADIDLINRRILDENTVIATFKWSTEFGKQDVPIFAFEAVDDYGMNNGEARKLRFTLAQEENSEKAFLYALEFESNPSSLVETEYRVVRYFDEAAYESAYEFVDAKQIKGETVKFFLGYSNHRSDYSTRHDDRYHLYVVI
jgi:hypothetical protein